MKPLHRLNFIATALVCALGAATSCAQTESSFYRPLTLAAAEATSSGGGGAGAEPEDQEAELAKKLQNPVAALFQIQQLLKIGKQPIAFQFGYRYHADKPSAGPDWGLRFTITFLFPK